MRDATEHHSGDSSEDMITSRMSDSEEDFLVYDHDGRCYPALIYPCIGDSSWRGDTDRASEEPIMIEGPSEMQEAHSPITNKSLQSQSLPNTAPSTTRQDRPKWTILLLLAMPTLYLAAIAILYRNCQSLLARRGERSATNGHGHDYMIMLLARRKTRAEGGGKEEHGHDRIGKGEAREMLQLSHLALQEVEGKSKGEVRGGWRRKCTCTCKCSCEKEGQTIILSDLSLSVHPFSFPSSSTSPNKEIHLIFTPLQLADGNTIYQIKEAITMPIDTEGSCQPSRHHSIAKHPIPINNPIHPYNRSPFNSTQQEQTQQGSEYRFVLSKHASRARIPSPTFDTLSKRDGSLVGPGLLLGISSGIMAICPQSSSSSPKLRKMAGEGGKNNDTTVVALSPSLFKPNAALSTASAALLRWALLDGKAVSKRILQKLRWMLNGTLRAATLLVTSLRRVVAQREELIALKTRLVASLWALQGE